MKTRKMKTRIVRYRMIEKHNGQIKTSIVAVRVTENPIILKVRGYVRDREGPAQEPNSFPATRAAPRSRSRARTTSTS